MCGIAGFSWLDETLIQNMTDALRHRGPDDEGVYTDAAVSLGHRRLSILDLSKLGRQPMIYDHCGRRVVVTFNGEIYNFRDIRRELNSIGYRFTSETDTEIIPAAYLEWGLDCVKRFNGMWAFAVYDVHRRLLVLSRDRFGEKPLYYSTRQGRIVFASEIKAILKHPLRRVANRSAVSNYLYWGLANQGKETFFDGIEMLPPAHVATYDLQTGSLKLHRYYEPAYGNRRVSAEQFRDALRQSVKSRLISDVPISVSLSSGIDSTSVAALTSDYAAGTIDAFSTASDDALGDETTLLESFLTRYPCFNLKRAFLSEESFSSNYRDIVFHMDEPFARQSAYVRWEIARQTKLEHRKVLLNGEGADEILGGYLPFVPHFLAYLARNFRLVRLAREAGALMRHPERSGILEAFRTGPFFPVSHGRRRLMDADRRRERFRISLQPIPQPLVQFSDIKDYLARLVSESSLPRLLNCNDKMTMANSVEARTPFLDHEFVDFVFSMDPSDLMVDGRRKAPLRQAMRGLVPDEILFRKNKDAFHAPIFDYLKNTQITQRIRDIFCEPRTSGVFNSVAYLAEYDRFLSGRGGDRVFLFHGLLLEEWARTFEVEFS
jgi:asparagine synthase (glutamine-hydrolysing)